MNLQTLNKENLEALCELNNVSAEDGRIEMIERLKDIKEPLIFPEPEKKAIVNLKGGNKKYDLFKLRRVGTSKTKAEDVSIAYDFDSDGDAVRFVNLAITDHKKVVILHPSQAKTLNQQSHNSLNYYKLKS